MPAVTIWIRKENEALWDKIPNKSKFVNRNLEIVAEKLIKRGDPKWQNIKK